MLTRRARVSCISIGQTQWVGVLTLAAQQVAKLFVAKHLPKANVDAAEKMLQNIRTAFRGVIQAEDWMQPETKDEAVDKLNNMFIQVSRPIQPAGRWAVGVLCGGDCESDHVRFVLLLPEPQPRGRPL